VGPRTASIEAIDVVKVLQGLARTSAVDAVDEDPDSPFEGSAVPHGADPADLDVGGNGWIVVGREADTR
jgi:hypothetical protein